MRKLLVLGLVLAGLLLETGCGWTTVGPGYVGIEVNQAGSQRGVQDFPIKTGRVFYNPITSSVIEYPTFVQTASWTANKNEGHPEDESITFTTKDNMVVNADVSISYHLESDKVPAFYVKFHLDDIDHYTHGFLHNVVRDKMNEIGGKYTVEQIMGDNGPYLQEVRDVVQAIVKDYGTTIDQFGFIGAPRPPEQVIQAINLKVQATQIALQKQNEVLQAEADAKKAVAKAQGDADSMIARAKGEAESNRVKAQSITQPLIEWYRLTNQHDQIWRWNGEMPKVVTGNGGGLLMQMPQ